MHDAVYWFDCKTVQNQGLVFWQTITNAIMLYESMPADCLVKVVKRNVDYTEARIQYHKVESDQREPPRIILREN